MTFQNPLLVVKEIERSKAFYQKVLGLAVEQDFGANVTLTGGICLQTLESWAGFIGTEPGRVEFGGRDAELYFEEKEFDLFVKRLQAMTQVQMVHPVLEHRWGQRAVRFYDPDHHIIEVGEQMQSVCRRFLDSGMTARQVAQRMDVPQAYVEASLTQPRVSE